MLKGGSWYLAGHVDGSVRTYRVARVLDCTALDDPVRASRRISISPPIGAHATERLEAEMHPNEATLRLSPFGVKLLDALSQPYVKARTQPRRDRRRGRLADRNDAGRQDAWHAATELLRLGAEAEVLEPATCAKRWPS